MTLSDTTGASDLFQLFLLATVGLIVVWFAHRLGWTNQLFGTSQQETILLQPKPKPKTGRNFVELMKQQKRRVVIFFGSQSGTAEDFANRLAKDCGQRYGVQCLIADIEHYDMAYLDSLPSNNLAFFVMATYGEGEPTDNAVEFWEHYIQKPEPEFSNHQSTTLPQLRYVIFGLGSKAYEHYNMVARVLDERLSALGATRIGERGEGDDDGSLEEDFLAWQESFWPSFCKAFGVDETNNVDGSHQPVYVVDELEFYEKQDVYFGELGSRLTGGDPIYNAKRPYLAPMTSRELMKGSDRHCLHIELDISGTNLSYQTGDHVAMWPTNNEDEVLRLASVLGLADKLDVVVMIKATDSTASKQCPFPVPSTYRAIFRHYLDICAPASRQCLVPLVEYAPTEEIRTLLKLWATDKDEYRLKVGNAMRNLGQVLELAAANESEGSFGLVPFDLIVESMSRLQPRYYSISSSSKEQPTTISATCVTLAYQPQSTPERTVFGVNSNFLYRIHLQDHPTPADLPVYDLAGPRQAYLDASGRSSKIPIHIRRSQFKLPRNTSVPVIMIGPGTGVAPFRGFVRERAFQKSQGKVVGPMLLFYGSRHPDQDFLYADEWSTLFPSLGRLVTAFSRETDNKVYVQHRLEQHGTEVWQWIDKKGAYIYVCGDARNMARGVNQTLIRLVAVHGNKSEAKAMEYVKSLRNIGRYLEDVWF